MKLLIDNTGQTCNKFWSYLLPIEYAILKKENVYVIFPDSKLDDFPNLINNRYLKLPLPYKWMAKLIGFKNLELISRKIFTNRLYDIIPFLCEKFPSVFWRIWSERTIEIKEETYKLVQKLFSPASSIKNYVDERFTAEHKDVDLIVGVHIRRGDYKKWLNGDFFFSFDEYVRICKLIEPGFENKRCKFFIASNEPVPKEVLHSLNSFTIKLNATADLYALSCCDLIIGPPSSFSRWASFYGRTPIRFIISPTTLTKSFRIISSYSKYSNGEQIEFNI